MKNIDTFKILADYGALGIAFLYSIKGIYKYFNNKIETVNSMDDFYVEQSKKLQEFYFENAEKQSKIIQEMMTCIHKMNKEMDTRMDGIERLIMNGGYMSYNSFSQYVNDSCYNMTYKLKDGLFNIIDESNVANDIDIIKQRIDNLITSERALLYIKIRKTNYLEKSKESLIKRISRHDDRFKEKAIGMFEDYAKDCNTLTPKQLRSNIKEINHEHLNYLLMIVNDYM